MLFRKCSLNSILKRFNSTSIHDMKIEYLKRSFEEFNIPNVDSFINEAFKSYRRSAVLVPISVRLERNKKVSKRTENLNRHKGQVCFPGGMCDAADKNELETALREANEEIGVNRKNVTFIAQICPLITSSKTLVTPVITFFDDTDYQPEINKNEVDLVFRLPTSRFITKENHDHKSVKIGSDDEYYIHYFKDKLDGFEITTWGVTALICILASSILHSRAPEFRVDPKFEFDKDKINDYLKFILEKNIERINNYEKSKADKTK